MSAPTPYASEDAEQDAGHVAVLLDMLVTEECELSRAGMAEEQVATLNRISTLAWIARDLARRLDAGLNRETAR
jgi:hypothetical protein